MVDGDDLEAALDRAVEEVAHEDVDRHLHHHQHQGDARYSHEELRDFVCDAVDLRHRLRGPDLDLLRTLPLPSRP